MVIECLCHTTPTSQKLSDIQQVTEWVSTFSHLLNSIVLRVILINTLIYKDHAYDVDSVHSCCMSCTNKALTHASQTVEKIPFMFI